MARKRVNLFIDAETYDALCRLRARYGFRSVCALSGAVLSVVAERLQDPGGDAAPDEGGDAAPDEGGDSAYIEGLFGEYAQAERPDTAPPRRRRKRRGADGQG